MPSRESVTYRVRDKGGKLGGKKLSFEIPRFELEAFLKAPNADEFIKKAYLSAAKKIGREVEERKMRSVPADLSSYEMIIARSLKYTKQDISNWLNSRDWSRISHFKNPANIRAGVEAFLPKLAMRQNYHEPDFSLKVAKDIVAALASKPDPVAEYLFVMLSVDRQHPYSPGMF